MKSTAKTVGIVMFITVFSRLLSLVSNMVYIAFFGIDIYMDIYSYSLQLPNIIFNSFGTALVTVVIPIFAGYIATGEKDRAYRFANNITSLSVVFTMGLTLVGMAIAPLIISLTRFKFEGFEFAVSSLRIMFPVMIFYGLNYIFQGILQSMGRYNMPAFVSVPSSLIVIFYVIFLGKRFGVKGLLIATFIGLASQALILIPALMRTEYRFRVSFDYRDEDIRYALRLIPPVLIGTSAYQLNMLFNTTLSANFKDTVALLTTVQNLVLYAVLAFIYSITSVFFPKFTMLAARDDMEGFKDNLMKVLKVVLFFLLPIATGFIAVRYQLIDFLYGWGKVTADNVSLASNMMALYSPGVIGIGIKEIVDRAFYSLKDTKRPAINGVVIMLANIASSLLLINFLGVLGIPAAYSISTFVGALTILFMMRKKVGAFGGRILIYSTLKTAASSGIMLLAILPLTSVLKQFSFGHVFVDKGLKLAIPVIAGVVVYFAVAYLLKVDEAIEVVEKIKNKFGGTNA